MKKILLIDDEPDFVEMIKMRLEANRYEVITALDGKDGLLKAEQEVLNLILLDVMMPGMDGFAVLRALKRNDRTRNIPVVMLTAKRETRSIMSADESGAVDYLIKPCDAEDLLKVVRKNALASA